MRIFAVVFVILLAADARADVGGYFGIGLGGTTTGGDAGAQLHTGFRVGYHAGARFGRWGADFRIHGGPLDIHRDRAMPEVRDASTLDYRSGVALYLVDTGALDLVAHAGLSFLSATGETLLPKPCSIEQECPNGTRLANGSVWFSGYGAFASATAQVHLGSRRGQHAMLWLDAGIGAVRYRIDTVVTGRALELSLGIADAF